MTSKKILEVCLSPDLGGLELYVGRCINELSKKFDVSCVIATNSKLKGFVQNTKKFELERKSVFFITPALKLAKIIDHENIDIIHIHWTKDIPVAVFAKVFSKRKPKIIQTRHMTMTRFKTDIYHKFLYKNIDTIICITKALEDQIKKYIPEGVRPKTKLLYLGAAEPKILDDREKREFRENLGAGQSFVVGLIGRINASKGQYLLIEAMRILKERKMDIKAHLVGHAMDDEYLESLKRRVINYNLEEMVKFQGFTNEPANFMQACDVVLMTSKNETFGLVTIEAMRNGVAVIGSNSGGVLEIIEDKKTGLLFECGNHRDLADKIEKLYKDNNLREKLAQAGKEKAERSFNSEKQFEKLSEFFIAL